MKILIFGNGWIGNKLKDALGADISQLRLEDASPETISKYDVVINSAGKTNIDWCEMHKAEALASNALAAGSLARLCAELGKKYVYISSACIFESADPDDWKDETSTPNPACFYALTKVIGEHLVLEALPEALIVRIRLPISEWPHQRNTLSKLINYQTLHTNQETVTVVEDMLSAFANLIETDAKGVFHLVNDDTISPIEMRESLSIPGDYRGIPKEIMDAQLKEAGRAKRVTTLVRSTRIPPLPSIRTRMPEIARLYIEHL